MFLKNLCAGVHNTMASIPVASYVDSKRVVQFLYEALAVAQQKFTGPEELILAMNSILEKETARVEALIVHCVEEHRASSESEEEVANTRPELELESQLQALQTEMEETSARVEKLRKSVPEELAQNLSSILEQCRPAHEADTPVMMESTRRQTAEFSPVPGNLQLTLTSASQRLPALRAKLTETVDRLKRVTVALTVDERMHEAVGGGEEYISTTIPVDGNGILEKHLATASLLST